MVLTLKPRITRNAQVLSIDNGWRLSIPSGSAGDYRWAQLDDYMEHSRSNFPWSIPLRLTLQARVSDRCLTGTWGFGFWNDPFNANLGLGGTARRLPALPNAAWYFFASQPNYLSLRDYHPAQGFLAATFSSPILPLLFYGVGLPFLPLLMWPMLARGLRRLMRWPVKDVAASLTVDPTLWHDYSLILRQDAVYFIVDGEKVFETSHVPRGRLGLVIWIDNQYAAFRSDGRLRFGTLDSPKDAWMEVRSLAVETGSMYTIS